MKFLIISGAPDTGKTTTINQIALWLTNGVVISDVDGNPLPTFLPDLKTGQYSDISVIIIVRNKKIIIHSATDDQKNMDDLIGKIKLHPDTEIVITSCRDYYWERNYFYNNIISVYASFNLEFPKGKVTRRNNKHVIIDLYNAESLNTCKHILVQAPYLI